MMIDATFWVMISFFAFIGLLIYFKIPQKIKNILDENINSIKNQIDEANKLKEDAKNILTEHEKKISNSKAEVKQMVNKANDEAEKNVIKTNKDFHNLMEARKRNAEERIKQLKNQALKDIKNTSVKISIATVESLIKKSIDKSKIENLYSKSLEQTKTVLNQTKF